MPADLVLVCGVFGNIPDDEVAGTIVALPSSPRPAAPSSGPGTVRSRTWCRPITAWFAEHGFALARLSEKDAGYGVGVHRFTGPPEPLRTGQRLFTFTKLSGR